ncbi:hypothetical protein NMY22_g16841 [Coprinellus aureogranulatus]|nr:hypothetical protein NMY22_g16841 [Coprinellus aureogranulatus]
MTTDAYGTPSHLVDRDVQGAIVPYPSPPRDSPENHHLLRELETGASDYGVEQRFGSADSSASDVQSIRLVLPSVSIAHEADGLFTLFRADRLSLNITFTFHEQLRQDASITDIGPLPKPRSCHLPWFLPTQLLQTPQDAIR